MLVCLYMLVLINLDISTIPTQPTKPTLKLSLFIFNNASMLYLYKSGKLKISDELYAKIKTGMAEIEKLESHTKKSYVSKISHKGYTQRGKIYSKVINTFKLEKTINEFSKFCDSDFTIDNFKDEKYRNVIIDNYNAFILYSGRCVDDNKMEIVLKNRNYIFL